MKRLIKKVRRAIKLNKYLKEQADYLTCFLPCVNLSVRHRIFHGFLLFNNCDKIAFLSYDDAEEFKTLGDNFFRVLIYSLCIKYSIDNY